MADTKRQEQASLVTFYYAIEKGANLGTLQEPAIGACLLYTSPSPRDVEESRMPSSA